MFLVHLVVFHGKVSPALEGAGERAYEAEQK
jgi:hypothetical protein